MVSILRKHQQTLMIFVTIIVIICFVWLYDPTRRGRGVGHEDRIGEIYGRPLSLNDAQRAARKLRVCSELGLMDLIRSLITDGRSEDEQISNFAFNNIVLKHEAEALGIVPTEEQYIEAVKKLPIFQTDGHYDANKFNDYIQRIAAFGFTEQLIEESVMDQLRLARIKELIASTLTPVPSEIRDVFSRGNQQTEMSYIFIKPDDISASVQVTDEDVKKAFEERKDTLRTEEKRKVRFVSFMVDQEHAKDVGRQKHALMQQLVDQASDFAVALTEKDAKLDGVAEKFGKTVAESPEFTLTNPPEDLDKSSTVATAAFQLTKEQPNSAPLTTPNGYYVLQLAEIIPPQPLTFDEAKPKIEADLKTERTEEALQLKVAAVRAQIAEALKAGKTFTEAAAAAGVTPETLAPFSLVQPGKLEKPEAMMLVRASRDLKDGQLSDPIPFGGGSLIAHVDKRLPVDDTAFEKEKATLMEEIANYRSESAFEVWLAERRKMANIRTGIMAAG
ncbi:MAG: peptidyl-prolyl cis-trans isomerase [Chthoniobacteraceae bacterium]